MASNRTRKRQAAQVVAGLNQEYADAECALRHRNPFELLVATILSAQCTDERVNIVTPTLFARFPTAEAMAEAPLETLETLIQSTGFFRNKARNIKACSAQLVARHGGEVPQQLDELVQLPGVGRKTANVVLGTAFGLPTGVVVDTHVQRVSRRLGLTEHKDPEKIERELMQLLPPQEWIDYSHRMIHHGRRVCKARRPLCEKCVFQKICPRVGVEA
ncbi:MAG: endonuclease III [Pirellulaceae bacterium]